MPFTFSHPALVLPFKYIPSKYISMTGLIVGSLTPDFEYFLRMKIQSNYSHTLAGVLWFDLPLGILLAFLFHQIIRNRLLENLPKFLRSRFYPLESFNWSTYFRKNWFTVLISVAIGAFSHIFWDSFTHPDGYFVENIPVLSNEIRMFNTEIPVLKFLQHGSSLLGMVFIIFVVIKLPRHIPIQNKTNRNYWIIFIFLTFIIVGIRLLAGLNLCASGNIIVTIIAAGIISLALTPCLMKQIKSSIKP